MVSLYLTYHAVRVTEHYWCSANGVGTETLGFIGMAPIASIVSSSCN